MRKETLNAITEGRGPIPLVKKMNYNGVVVYTYSIGWLSYWSKLAAVTLRLWQRTKILPAPVFGRVGMFRWYTAAEIVQYSAAIERHYTASRDLVALRTNLSTIRQRIVKQYKNLTPASQDQTLIMLPNYDVHEAALMKAANHNRSSAKDNFFTKVKRSVKPKNETHTKKSGLSDQTEINRAVREGNTRVSEANGFRVEVISKSPAPAKHSPKP